MKDFPIHSTKIKPLFDTVYAFYKVLHTTNPKMTFGEILSTLLNAPGSAAALSKPMRRSKRNGK